MDKVFLYSHKNERVTRLIEEQILLRGGHTQSISELADQPIWDALHQPANTHTGTLIERIFGFPSEIIDQYATSDQTHGKFEWYAYLQHLRTRYDTTVTTLSNPFIYKWQHSLPHQYLAVSKICPQLKIPKHGFSKFFAPPLSTSDRTIFKPNPFEIQNWKPNASIWVSDSKNKDFYVIRPEGEVVHALSFGSRVEFKGSAILPEEKNHLVKMIERLNRFQKLNIREFLFYRNSHQKFTFAMYSSIISTVFADEDLRSCIDEAFAKEEL